MRKDKKGRPGLSGILLFMMLFATVFPATGVFAATLNVTAYGADGSDGNDDAAAINSTILAAAAGDTVYLPAGTYYVSTSIILKSGVKLEGQSRDTTVIKFNGTSDAPIINLTGKSDVEITGLTLDGNGSPYVTRGIVGEPAAGANIHHNRIRGLAQTTGFGPFGILFSGSDDVEITDNDFQNIGVNSVWGGAIRVGWGSDHPQILRNTIANTGRGGIFLNDGLTGAVIRENTITGSGVHSHGLSIELHTGVNESVIEDNVVDHWISVVISDYNAIRRNTVRATDGTYKSYGLEISSGNSVVTDNWVDGGQHLGISSSPARDYTYYGYNRIEDMIQWGMQFQGVSSTVLNNHQYFYKNQFLNTDKDNTLAVYGGHAGYGVRLHGYSTNITFDSNVISGNERYGINITDTLPGIDKISFINNTITHNGLETIDYYPPSAGHLEWSGNTVFGNGTDIQLTSRGFGNQKPTANFAAPVSIQLGQTASFTNTSTDADGTVSHYLWDFGEGIPATAVNPTHLYQKPGTYRVTLMATDNEGRSSIKEQLIQVYEGAPDTQAPSAPSGLASPWKTDTAVGLVWNPSTDNFAVAGYDIYANGSQIGFTGGAVTSYTAAGLLPETVYNFSVKARDAAHNVSAASNTLTVTTNEPPGGGTGSIIREYWSNVSGTVMSSIPVHTAPTGTQTLTSLEGPSNWGDNYGARIRGYITPDITGAYTFRIASDDKSELWLSSSNNPAGKVLIASVGDWTNPREWNKYPSQQSSPVTLTGGQAYYVEVLHKEGHSGDHVAVGWTGPGIESIAVVSGGYLTPYGGGSGNPDPADTQPPTAPTNLTAPSKTSVSVSLSWTASTDNVGVTGYNIYKGGVLEGSTAGTAYTATGLSANTAYSFTVKAKDAANNESAASNTLSVTTAVYGGPGGGGTGTIVREYWTGVGGETIADIPLGTPPTGTSILTTLEGPSNFGNSYATRIRGYITPAVSGDYTFYIASDNAGELWLSPDSNPANKSRIAYVSTWSGYRDWTGNATQKSVTLSLTAGQAYYVEVLHKEKSSSDHLSVGWTGPGISAITVIDGSYLSPYPTEGGGNE